LSRADAAPVLEFLDVATPETWLAAAQENLPTLLIDHANCEKKAASTALGLMYRYVDQPKLLRLMSRLAREELRHFEQVLDVMRDIQVAYVHVSPSRYAASLHRLVRRAEPGRLVDVLILGAVVEARSCERFLSLGNRLDGSMAQLYRQLVHSEARHFADYLDLAREVATGDVDQRILSFLAMDAELITGPDPEFRFHSGAPG